MAGVNANFTADFSTFLRAINEADVKLADFGKGAEKVEGQLNGMIDKFSGRKAIQEASELTIAINQLGGVSTLTAKEIAQVGAKANEAVEKLQKLGYEVPQGLRDLADATKEAATANTGYAASFTELGLSWTASIASGQILADMFWKLVDVAKSAATELPKIAMAGAAFDSVEQSFNRLTEAAQLNAGVLLGDLNTATHNQVTNLELMKTVNQGLAAGMQLTREEYGTMAKAAFALAQAEGIGVTEAMNKVNDAMLTGRSAALGRIADLGKIKQAEDTIAAAHGQKLADMSEEDQMWVKREAMLQQVAASQGRLGDSVDGLAEHVGEAGKKWDDFIAKLGQAIATSPVLEAGYQGLKQALGAAFGDSQQEMVKSVTMLVNQAAIGVVDLSKVVVQAGIVIVENFSKARLTVRELVEAIRLANDPTRIADFISTQKAIFEEWVRTTATARKEGDAYIQILDKTRASMVEAAKGSGDLAAGTKGAGEAAAGTGAALDGAGAAADRYNNRLKDLSKTEGQMAAEAKKITDAINDLNSVGTSYHGTLDQMDQGTRAVVEALLSQGASMQSLVTIYGLTTSQAKAFAEQQKEVETATKAQQKIANDTTQIWNEYFATLDSQGGTAMDKQIAAADKWAANLKAKTQGAIGDFTAYFDAIDARRNQMVEGAQIDWNKVSAASNRSLDEAATKARATYNYMRDHFTEFSEDAIQKASNAADKAEQLAQGIGQALSDGFQKPQPHIDATKDKVKELTGSIQLAAAASAQLGDVMNSYFPQGTNGAARLYMYGGDTAGEAAYKAAGGIINPGVGLSTMPHRAAGGPVAAGTSYVVGERGPELFVPNQSGSIAPNGAGVVVHNTFNIVDTESNIARRVADQITRSVMRSTRLS